MELLIENIIIYSFAAILSAWIVIIYIRKKNRESKIVDEKIRRAKEEGFYEPVSLHPFIDINTCIGTGACVTACPEKDIIGKDIDHDKAIPILINKGNLGFLMNMSQETKSMTLKSVIDKILTLEIEFDIAWEEF